MWFAGSRARCRRGWGDAFGDWGWHTRLMRRPRHAFLVLLILGLAGFAVPAVTLAAGGGSAGDQQYTDPFGGSGGGRATKTTATSTAPTPPPTTPPATTPPATAPATAPATTAPAPAPGATSTPTAVAATSGRKGKTLPFTGYDGRLAALLGAGLVLGGAGLRIRLRRS